MCKIYILEDHPLIVQSVQHLIASMPNFEVIGFSQYPQAFFSAIENESVDILLLDLNLSGESGVEVLKEVVKNHSTVKVIVLTMYDSPLLLKRLLMFGASGFIVKQSGLQEIQKALEVIYGPTVFCKCFGDDG